MRTDVLVVGGGPAGSTAAIRLARAGRSVTLIDKATFPRDKCCGDGLTTSALRQLEAIGLKPQELPSWRVVEETTWRSPSGHAIHLSVPSNDGIRIAVARRTELDAALLELARAAGVTVLENNALEHIATNADGAFVSTSAGNSLESKLVIAADGMWSATRRALNANPDGNKRYLGEIHAFRQYFTNVTGVARDQLWVSFEPDLLPGYVWSFPIGDGQANVGFGIERKSGKSVQWMAKKWPEILARPHVRAALGDSAQPESPHKSWPIPAKLPMQYLSAGGGRVLFVGDAARAVDPLTGEGIGQAMQTSQLAVDAFLSHPTNPSRAAKQYRHSIARGLWIDNGFSRRLADLVRTERGARAVIRLAPAGPWKGQYALRWVFEDNPRAGLLTPWRWGERFTTKAGAYR
jgi:menaquinone-9 beta-reductase